VDDFYRLHLLTRRRLGLPIQPRRFFDLLEQEVLAAGLGFVVTARVGDVPVAAAVFLTWNNMLVYKYGASDERFYRFGAMTFLLWKATLDAKNRGLSLLDLGRTDADNSGLSTFKERLGATRSTLTYLRLAGTGRQGWREERHVPGAAWIFSRLPDELLVAVGRLLYRHMG